MATTHAETLDQHRALVDHLDERVRALVRGEGVDPQRDATVVRRIAEGVVRDHDERSLTGQVAPVPDVGTMFGELVARVAGFGPLQPFLDDPAVEEVWINDPSSIRKRFPRRAGGRPPLRSFWPTTRWPTRQTYRCAQTGGQRPTPVDRCAG